jgi:hypothetical protein
MPISQGDKTNLVQPLTCGTRMLVYIMQVKVSTKHTCRGTCCTEQTRRNAGVSAATHTTLLHQSGVEP